MPPLCRRKTVLAKAGRGVDGDRKDAVDMQKCCVQSYKEVLE